MTATEVTIPSDSTLLYRELIKQKVNDDDLLTYLYCGYVTVDWRSRNPGASAAAISAKLAECSASIQSALSGQASVLAYRSADTAGLAAAAGAVRAAGGDVGNLLSTLVGSPARAVRPLLLPEAGRSPGSQAGAFSTPGPLAAQPGTDAVLGVIATAVGSDADLRSALDSFAQSSGNKIGLPWPSPGSATANRDVLAMSANWPKPIQAGLQPDGSVVVTVQSLATEFDTQMTNVSAVTSDMSGQVQAADAAIAAAAPSAGFGLGDLSVDFNVVLASLSAARPAAADASNKAATDAANNSPGLKIAKDAVSTLAQVVGLVDPQAGQIVKVVGDAAISVATAINDFAKTTQTLAQMLGQATEAASMIAGALFTGNVIAAAASIIGVFASSGPSPEMALLQNIQKAITQLSQQVAALKQDVDTRLDHIDAKLTGVLQEVENGFAALADLAALIQATLAGIASQLVQLAQQVNRIDADMQAWLQLVEVQTDLLEKGENPVLDWRYTHLDPADILPFSGADPGFAAADNIFYTWATGIAVSEPQVTATAPANPVSIAAQLTKPLNWNVNVIAGALANLKAPSFYDGGSGSPLPNPVVWARAASDYAELQLEWLDYAEKLTAQRIADVAGPGVTLLGALATLATLSHQPGVPAASPVFGGVRDGYLAALDGQPQAAGSPPSLISALQAALKTWQNTYVNTNIASLPGGTQAPDPFGPVDQDLILGHVTAWAMPDPMPLGNAPGNNPPPVARPDQSSMIPYLPPILRNYFYFNAPERANFALLLFDPGFLNPVTHVKWNQNHTDEIDWDTGTYGVRAEIRYNTNNTKDPTSWPVVLRRTIDTRVQGGGTAVMPGDQDTYTWLTTGTNWQAHVLPAFLAAGQADPLSPSEQTALDALIIALTPSVTASLQNVQANACQYLGAAVTGSGPDATTVAASAQALSAWQELIIQLIRLAMPGRIVRDDLLRCLMYGPQAPPGQSDVAGILAARAAAPKIGASILTDLATAANARITALHDAVINALLALESAGVYDWPPDVFGAVQRLQLVAAARPDGPAITLPARSPGVAPVDTVLTNVITAGATGHVLAVAGTGTVTAGPADGTASQQWHLQVQPDASYQLVSQATGQCPACPLPARWSSRPGRTRATSAGTSPTSGRNRSGWSTPRRGKPSR